jgi:hypothetical protein
LKTEIGSAIAGCFQIQAKKVFFCDRNGVVQYTAPQMDVRHVVNCVTKVRILECSITGSPECGQPFIEWLQSCGKESGDVPQETEIVGQEE